MRVARIIIYILTIAMFIAILVGYLFGLSTTYYLSRRMFGAYSTFPIIFLVNYYVVTGLYSGMSRRGAVMSLALLMLAEIASIVGFLSMTGYMPKNTMLEGVLAGTALGMTSSTISFMVSRAVAINTERDFMKMDRDRS